MIFTFIMLAVYRIGAQIPTPGIDAMALQEFFKQIRHGRPRVREPILRRRAREVHHLRPGHHALHHLVHHHPTPRRRVARIEKLQEGGAEGRKKIIQYTRYLTIFICMIHSTGISVWLKNLIAPAASAWWRPRASVPLLTVIILTAGAAFIMWLESRSPRGASAPPSSSINTSWVWDLRKTGGLPPATQIEYWWTADDAAGKHAETAHANVSFDDNRYKWQSVTQSPVTIYWYSGDTTLANALMTAAQQGLQRIENDTGAIPTGTVRIYIYDSATALQGAQLFTPQWEGGATFTGYNVIAIGVPPSDLAYGQRAVPHELTHWIVGQVTFNDYGAGLPTWLDEGLATYGEGTLNPQYQSALNAAIKNKTLISIRSLASPFSADATQAYTSYGESNSIVTFMIQKYGKDKMIQLLDAFHDGAGYDEALQKVYGFDQDGLQTVWLASILPGSSTSILIPYIKLATAALNFSGMYSSVKPVSYGDYFEY